MAILIKNRQIVTQLSPPDLVLEPTDDPAGLLHDHGWDAEAIPFNEVASRVGTEFPFHQGGRIVIARR